LSPIILNFALLLILFKLKRNGWSIIIDHYPDVIWHRFILQDNFKTTIKSRILLYKSLIKWRVK